VDAEGPPDPGGADDLLHEVRMFHFKLREFIDDHDEVRYRNLGFAFAV
jgi:hypothetical protein